jgi:hypothetical protein
MTTSLLVDIVGWIGAILLLVAYGMISAGKTHGRSYLYQGLNFAGSLGLIVNSTFYTAYPSTFVNVFWIGIAIVTSIRAWKGGARATPGS